MEMFLVLTIRLVLILNFCASEKLHSMEPSNDVNGPAKGLTSFSKLSYRTTLDTSIALSKQEEKYKHENFESSIQETYKAVPASSFDEQFNKREDKDLLSHSDHSSTMLYPDDAQYDSKVFVYLESSPSDRIKQNKLYPRVSTNSIGKRNTGDDNGDTKNISKGKQKKVKALGRLLMNSVATRNYDDIQDDYTEDEDDDYSKGANGEKMNWEDYQNEDGASVMELIALNARHKKNMRRARGNEHLY